LASNRTALTGLWVRDDTPQTAPLRIKAPEEGRYMPVRRKDMLYYAVVFLVIALIAGALGFFGVAGAAVGIAKILFFVFLVLFVVSLLMGRRSSPPL